MPKTDALSWVLAIALFLPVHLLSKTLVPLYTPHTYPYLWLCNRSLLAAYFSPISFLSFSEQEQQQTEPNPNKIPKKKKKTNPILKLKILTLSVLLFNILIHFSVLFLHIYIYIVFENKYFAGFTCRCKSSFYSFKQKTKTKSKLSTKKINPPSQTKVK